MKYSLIPIIILCILISSCSEDDVALPDCESNVSLIINGIAKCGMVEVTGYELDLDENREAIGMILNPGADISENKINVWLAPPAGNLFIQGKSYDYKSEEGSSFSGSRIGAIHSASVRIIKLDRENQLLSVEVSMDIEQLPTNDSWKMTGVLSDLPMNP